MNSTGQYLGVSQNTVGVYISSNYGNNWNKTFTSLQNIYHMTSNSSGQYAACTINTVGVYVSSNYGNNWNIVLSASQQWFSVVTNSTGQYLAANAINYNLYISSNYGINWRNTFLSEQWRDIAIDSTGQNILAASLRNVWSSSDYGNYWKYIGFANANNFSSAISLNGKNLYLLNNNGIYTNVNDIIQLTNILVNNSIYQKIDLAYLFKPYQYGLKAPDTKIIVNGDDLNNYFEPYQVGSSTKDINLYVGTTDIMNIFNNINNQQLFAYPPFNQLTTYGTSILTNLSYGNGTYIVTSTNPGFVGYGPFYISPSSTPANRWQISGAYYVASTYNGFTIYSLPANTLLTTVSGVSYNGHWLQLELPYKINLKKFSLIPYAYGAGNITQNLIVAGSNDNINWTFLCEMKLESLPNQNQRLYFDVNTTIDFIQYRIILISSFQGSPTYFELQLHSDTILGDKNNTISTFSPNENSHRTNSWTYNGVSWTVYKSSEATPYGQLAYKAFFTSSMVSDSSRWVPYNGTKRQIYGTSNGNGMYTGTYSTVIQNGIGTVNGEWIEIEASFPLKLIGFSLTAWQDGGHSELPNNFYICGSNDRSIWYPIIYISFTANPAILNSNKSTPIYIIPLGTVTGGTLTNLTFNTYNNSHIWYTNFRMAIPCSIGGTVSGISAYGYMSLGNWTPIFSP